MTEDPNNPASRYSHERYAQLVEETITNLKKLGELKGGEYAGDSDRLANFRRNAAALGLPMESIWAVYCAKHWDAVMQYVKDLNSGKDRVRLEPLSGRLDDIIVYCILFKAMLDERDTSTLVESTFSHLTEMEKEYLAMKETSR